jgi:predicted naringenin-chalcone synthase
MGELSRRRQAGNLDDLETHSRILPEGLFLLPQIVRRQASCQSAMADCSGFLKVRHHYCLTGALRPINPGAGKPPGNDMTTACLNRIATIVPPHDVHSAFIRYLRNKLDGDPRARLFERMAARACISHRWTCLDPDSDLAPKAANRDGFYVPGRFPTTGERMRRFEIEAPALAARAVRRLVPGDEARRISHLIVVTCTGLHAPGIDLAIVAQCGLDPSVERTVVGFMGCQGSVNGLRLARHIVRSEPDARVLLVSVELCTLHLRETDDLDHLLSFLIFGDGSAAAVVSADPTGLVLDDFRSLLVPEADDLITWNVRDSGFDMFLSGEVPAAIGRALRGGMAQLLDGAPASAIDRWAVHPGGRTVLDAVEAALDLAPAALETSRAVLRDFGNMSSATLLFVLDRMIRTRNEGERGFAMAFGPGLSAETFAFRVARG